MGIAGFFTRKTFAATFVHVVILFSCLSSQPLYQVSFFSTAPTIDGDSSDACWQEAEWTEVFRNNSDSESLPYDIKAKIGRDDTRLLLLFAVNDPVIFAGSTVPDAGFYSHDDLVEMFIDPDGDGLNYGEIGVNALGNIYDYLIINPGVEENSEWQTSETWTVAGIDAAVTLAGTNNVNTDVDDGWIAEIAIPFTSLAGIGADGAPEAGASWRMDLFRYDYDHTCQSDPGPAEWGDLEALFPLGEYAWSPTGPTGVHYPPNFGTIEFLAKQDVPVQPIVRHRLPAAKSGPVEVFDIRGRKVPVDTRRIPQITLKRFGSDITTGLSTELTGFTRHPDNLGE